jgi:hypothetical protein
VQENGLKMPILHRRIVIENNLDEFYVRFLEIDSRKIFREVYWTFSIDLVSVYPTITAWLEGKDIADLYPKLMISSKDK